MKPRSWWRTFLEDPHGSILVGEREIPIRAIQTRSERLKDLVSAVQVKSEKLKEAVSAAYKEKYNTPGSVQYVKDMSRKKSRDTTTEFVPV